jgi:hypothetical protein
MAYAKKKRRSTKDFVCPKCEGTISKSAYYGGGICRECWLLENKKTLKRGSLAWKKQISKTLKEKNIKPAYSFPKGHKPWNKGLKGVMKPNNGSFISGQMSGEDNPSWKGGLPFCSECGVKLKNYDSKLCRACWIKSKRKNLDVKSEVYQRKKFYRLIRDQVIKRDNYTCQICGNNNNLHVDHIQSWADFPNLRFDINNCRTLCASCHYKLTFNKEMSEDISAWGAPLNKGENVH